MKGSPYVTFGLRKVTIRRPVYEGSQRTNETRTDSSTVKYRYDNIGQLKVADSSVAAEDRGYVYDAAGNLAWRTNNGTVGAFEVDTVNQLTSDAEGLEWYDANGNLIWRVWGEDPYWWLTAYLLYEYRYDDENRLIMVISYDYGQAPVWRTEFVYDGMGRRREQIEYEYSEDFPGGTETGRTRYVYDGKRVIQERDGGNTPLVSYTRGNDLSGTLEGAGGIGGLLARSGSYSSGNWTNHAFYHADGNGNITCMVNTNQTVVASYRYDPFGKTISQSGSLATANVYRFSSKEFHAVSGMYYYGERFYEPNLQRWLNRDPIGELGGVNLYTYADENPINEYDPLGFEGTNDAPKKPVQLPSGEQTLSKIKDEANCTKAICKDIANKPLGRGPLN